MDQNPTPVAPAETPAVAPAAPAKGANKNLIIGIIAAVVVVAVAVVVLIVVLGGNKSDAPATNGGSGSTAELSKCGDAFKCFESINEGATVESINALTGIEGKASEYSDTSYTWEFPNGESLKFSSGSYFSIEVDYDTDLHKDSKVNFDGYSTVKDKIKSGITVDELAEALGTKGLLYKKDSFGFGYLWVDSNGGHLYANVSLKGNVTLVSGRF